MSITRKVARPMMAAMFIHGGLDAFKNPESKKEKAETVAPAIADKLGLPDDTVTLVRVNGAVMMGAGALLALGWFPRLAATALAGTLVPTTVAGHRFWEETDKQVKAQQMTQFLKNVSMLGGLIIAATDTAGKPSLGWRARRAASRARAALPVAS
jgi:putative oxidoreductase